MSIKRQTGMFQLFLILFAILYFISPFDLLPDFIPGFGRIDDLIVMFLIYWNYFRKGRQPVSGRSGTQRTTGGERSEKRYSGRPDQTRGRRDPYQILGLEPSADLEDIKRAYRQQANRYHPDKVAHLGDEFQALAKQKFQDIQWAYEELMRRKG